MCFLYPILYSHIGLCFEIHNYSNILSTKIIIIYTNINFYALGKEEQRFR